MPFNVVYVVACGNFAAAVDDCPSEEPPAAWPFPQPLISDAATAITAIKLHKPPNDAYNPVVRSWRACLER
ncbi:hypothetical protein [Actinomadura alba]|uniref:hypothetical protein n=1 Tax=Actinomadura alba TaxID=406431 RepID=UPI001FEA6EB6|nr:hypothetical protein [Actinomadura alba]